MAKSAEPKPTKEEKAAAKEEKKAEKVETIEDQGIGPGDPYPTGSPPVPPETEPEQEG